VDERLSFVVLTNGGHVQLEKVRRKIAAVWLPGVDNAPPNGRIGKDRE
jgi:hypothetical protein